MNIKKILVPMGGSVYSQHTLRYAVMFAKKFQAELFSIYVKDIRFFEGPLLSFVYDSFISESYLVEKKERIKSLFDGRAGGVRDYFTSACQNDDIKCSFKIQTGLVSNAILDSAKNVDLVIMGKQGEHASWLKRQLGSVSTRVIHNINKPLLVVGHLRPQDIKKVLLCYAGGHYAEKALKLTRYIIVKTGFELAVLTIATKRTRAIEVQKEAKNYFDSKKIKAHYLLTIGDVEKEIVKVRKIENINMLITGASSHRNYEDYISFCLANKILYDTDIPVLFAR